VPAHLVIRIRTLTRAPCAPKPATSPGVLEGKVDRECRVDLPGGPLFIEWAQGDNHIYMTGPAELVFDGTVSLL